MTRLVLLIGLMLGHGAFAQTNEFKKEFCERAVNHQQSELLGDADNRIAFTNHGGIFNSGVCWWHSRLQRSSAYLVVFRPDLPKPTTSDAVLTLLRRIRSLKSVVEIPGYQNFEEFTAAWHKTTQTFLNRWQIQDAVLYQAWIKGLSGSPRADAPKLQSLMIKLKEQVINLKRVAYLKLQLKGIAAHAWLVYSLTEIPNGLKLGIVDSNYRNLVEYEYHWGDPSITTKSYGSFMPYLEQSQDFEWINSALSDYCS